MKAGTLNPQQEKLSGALPRRETQDGMKRLGVVRIILTKGGGSKDDVT